ncbi:MAG TPA: glycosyltransferase family 2 protein, partial [Rhodopila sp.]|nr:glycosyltransferase family 2 protein [Rhodopila sp.]
RRLAMAFAAAHAGRNGILLTTDADATPSPDWIARNLAALHAGADLICGRALIDPKDAGLIPPRLLADEALERELAEMLDSLAWTLDPEPHDPPLRHTEASGASLAITTAMFHKIGGVPAVPCGEDRALVRAVWEHDGRVRHDPGIAVTVSGRVTGRAVGGMAETLMRRMTRQDEFADEQVEPPQLAWQRYALRRRVRMCRLGGSEAGLAEDLMISPEYLRHALRRPFFGATWAALEAASPVLVKQRVRFADLPEEIAMARALLPADMMAAD